MMFRSKPPARLAVETAPPAAPRSLADKVRELVIGQSEAIGEITPFVDVFNAGLAPYGRPAGVVMMLGPTGTGKTKSAEALAEVLHGSSKYMVKINCGELQMEHEVVKLTGAAPGYIGHRETTPLINQAKITAATSENCPLSLILFDEIEKASMSITRILLGILDKATMLLSDGNMVNFEKTIIFFTSNLGAKSIQSTLTPDFGFEAMLPRKPFDPSKIHGIGMSALKQKFSPEFVNRIDQVITYKPLERKDYMRILDIEIENYFKTMPDRLGERAFAVRLSQDAKDWIVDRGCSVEYGARELKRTIQRSLIRPLAASFSDGLIPPMSMVIVTVASGGSELDLSLER